MFGRPEVTHLQREPAGHLFETTIILAAGERNGRVIPFSRPTASTSPLLQRYQELASAEVSPGAAQSPERTHAE